jgi:hypothetical protein
MKRAVVIFVAILAMLLVYPATTPSAKPPTYSDTPTIIHILPPGDGTHGNSGEDDEGDGDDLAGIKPGTRPHGGGEGSSVYWPAGPQARAWWMYFIRVIRIVF